MDLKLDAKNIIDMEVESISGIHVVEEYNNNETNDIIHVDGDNDSDSYVSQDETCTVELITSECNDEVPQEGMRFESPIAAFDFYNKYGKRMGFNVRCSSTHRSRKDGSVIAREYVCSKQGLWQKKYEGNQSQPYTRIECQAKLRIKKDAYDIWFISKHKKDHSHAFTSPSKVHLLRSHRTIPKAMREMIYMYNSCRLTAPKITKVMSTQVGGPRSLPFVDVNCKNAIYNNQKKNSKLVGGDAEGLMEFFATKSVTNPLFAYKIQVDEDGRLTNFFEDVLIFDTTYKTNAYGMPCAPILGVNYHTKTIFLGCALLHREDEERQPNTIITDQDRAMALAIKNVFLESRHRLCRWHITQKIEQKMVQVERKYPSFRGDLYKYIDHCTIIMEFEDDDWMQSLYEMRHQWIDVYLQDCFFAGNRTSGRSKAMNKDVKAYVNSHTSLTTFVSRLQELIDKKFDEENNTDFKSHNETLVMKIVIHVERQMAQIYFPTIFKNFFQSELMKATDLTCEVQEDDGMKCTFSLKEYGACYPAHTIVFSNNEEKVTRSCHLYEHMGIPCSHILRVFYYIMKRWTKDVTKGAARDGFGIQVRANREDAYSMHYNDLFQRCNMLLAIDYVHGSLSLFMLRKYEVLDLLLHN
ncbi:hypothetical protein AMTRI_Chr12g237160 [Amborella trichopoda]